MIEPALIANLRRTARRATVDRAIEITVKDASEMVAYIDYLRHFAEARGAKIFDGVDFADTAAPDPRDAIVSAAVAMVNDGMSETGWHRIRRAVEAMGPSQ